MLLALDAGIQLPKEDEEEWAQVMTGLDEQAQAILSMKDYVPVTDLEIYSRDCVETPNTAEARQGWALKVCISCIHIAGSNQSSRWN